MHTLLFTLANTAEAAALGNELALPVAHTSLQLLTKFHYKNLYYMGEHRGMQEHCFISRYLVEFVGQAVKRLCYALRLRLSLLVHTATTHRGQPRTSHCFTYQSVHRTKISSTLASGYNPLCDNGTSCSTAAQGSNILRTTRKATLTCWSWWCSGNWNCGILPISNSKCCAHLLWRKFSNLNKNVQVVSLVFGHLPRKGQLKGSPLQISFANES